jgi:D-sedoheptulose 7-phosphate isomerase
MSFEFATRWTAQLNATEKNFAGLAKDQAFATRLNHATRAIIQSLRAGSALLVAGNGGSAADAMHIAGELVGRFLKNRPALNARALSADPCILTAWSNDFSYDTVFSRQVEAYGARGGILLLLSTSGNSPNVILAARTARALGMTVIALTGAGGGVLAAEVDWLLNVPASETPRIQELHIATYHFMCEAVESSLFQEESRN